MYNSVQLLEFNLYVFKSTCKCFWGIDFEVADRMAWSFFNSSFYKRYTSLRKRNDYFCKSDWLVVGHACYKRCVMLWHNYHMYSCVIRWGWSRSSILWSGSTWWGTKCLPSGAGVVDILGIARFASYWTHNINFQSHIHKGTNVVKINKKLSLFRLWRNHTSGLLTTLVDLILLQIAFDTIFEFSEEFSLKLFCLSFHKLCLSSLGFRNDSIVSGFCLTPPNCKIIYDGVICLKEFCTLHRLYFISWWLLLETTRQCISFVI